MLKVLRHVDQLGQVLALRTKLLWSRRREFQNTDVFRVTSPSEKRLGRHGPAEPLEQQTRADLQALTLRHLQGLSLKSGQSSRLHESVDPNRIESGQIASQSAHITSASPQIARRTELQHRQRLEQR